MKYELMTALTLAAMMTMAQLALAADGSSKANLAQQANNPIANMISVPLQLNANYGVGPRDQNQKGAIQNSTQIKLLREDSL